MQDMQSDIDVARDRSLDHIDFFRDSRAHFELAAPTHHVPIPCTLTIRRDGFVDAFDTFRAWDAVVPRTEHGPRAAVHACRQDTCPAMFGPEDSFHPALLQRVLVDLGSPDSVAGSPVLELADAFALDLDRRVLANLDAKSCAWFTPGFDRANIVIGPIRQRFELSWRDYAGAEAPYEVDRAEAVKYVEWAMVQLRQKCAARAAAARPLAAAIDTAAGPNAADVGVGATLEDGALTPPPLDAVVAQLARGLGMATTTNTRALIDAAAERMQARRTESARLIKDHARAYRELLDKLRSMEIKHSKLEHEFEGKVADFRRALDAIEKDITTGTRWELEDEVRRLRRELKETRVRAQRAEDAARRCQRHTPAMR